MIGADEIVQIMLCGDVMLGRGIDQVLPHPGDPRLFEPYMDSAVDYVALAESANGPIPKPVSFSYVWGDALEDLAARHAHLRIINLETAVTQLGRPEPKGINYRMHPDNVPCLSAAGIDCCVLANNHTLDWGVDGLVETLDSLERAGFAIAGAGRTSEAAAAPAVLPIGGGARVLVYAIAMPSSGAPAHWEARPDRPGVDFVAAASDAALDALAKRVRGTKRPADIVVLSIHWGPNWGYDIPAPDRAFARALVERAGVDVVFGHSSHHPKAIEVHAGRPILYGCGDFLNDYEGIRGREEYRGDLVLMYLVSLAREGGYLKRLDMLPYRIRKFRLSRPEASEVNWRIEVMTRECQRFVGCVEPGQGGALELVWQ